MMANKSTSIYLVGYLVILGIVLGCTTNRADEDTDSDTKPLGRDSVTIDTQDSDAPSDTDEDTALDSADGLGGIDEECYTYDQDGTMFMWCDTPELLMQQCDQFASGCCCRAACEPTMCEGADETLPCTPYDAVNLLGYCDYAVDNVPVTYECLDVCTPRSACLVVDTDGACLDTDAEGTGVCLAGGEDTDADAFCQPLCSVVSCDDTHYCSPMISGGYYDGSGACLPM